MGALIQPLLGEPTCFLNIAARIFHRHLKLSMPQTEFTVFPPILVSEWYNHLPRCLSQKSSIMHESSHFVTLSYMQSVIIYFSVLLHTRLSPNQQALLPGFLQQLSNWPPAPVLSVLHTTASASAFTSLWKALPLLLPLVNSLY